MRIEYETALEIEMPSTLDIYYGDGNTEKIAFLDDGSAPDTSAGDRNYAAFVQEDINTFVGKITAMEGALTARGRFTHFTGHLGESITKIPHFNLSDFNHNLEVEVDARLINGVDCDDDLLKQNSLFITDLSVVEDEARTYNFLGTGSGNPIGVWTFGSMIKNAANESLTGVSAKTLLKEWIKGWTDGRTINGQSVLPRTDALILLIRPWLKKASNNTVLPGNVLITNWSTYWDTVPEDSLLKYAPFKLTAIVNRIDLRGNSGYTHTLFDGGETRFIFSLLALYDYPTTKVLAGEAPRGADGISSHCNNVGDWKGMNVIFEYGNPFKTRCAQKDFAQLWLDLSGETLGSATYNAKLETITHYVLDANAIPQKANGSALERIRTNERIFHASNCGIQGQDEWPNSDWELSQFELDPVSHLLVPQPVTNTPMNQSNFAANLEINGTTTLLPTYAHGGTKRHVQLGDPADTGANALLSWMLWKKFLVENGNHEMPNSYTFGGDTYKLAATAQIDGEQRHFWDMHWEMPSNQYYTTISPTSTASYAYEKKLRQQLSLNTCQGCHAGETKTLFTQVRPLGYGQSANYWGTIPDYDTALLDNRFTNNLGHSKTNGTIDANHALGSGLQIFTRVSAFLTGRSYTGEYGSGTFADDDKSSQDNSFDPFFSDNSLYVVYDPTDNYKGITNTDETYPKADRQNFGYNDLQMRKQHLCQFLNSPCKPGSIIFALIMDTRFIPFAPKAH